MPAGQNPSLCAPLGSVWFCGRQRGCGAGARLRAGAVLPAGARARPRTRRRAVGHASWSPAGGSPAAADAAQGSARRSRFPTLLIADDGKICKDCRHWEPAKRPPRSARSGALGRSAGESRPWFWPQTAVKRRDAGSDRRRREGPCRPTCCHAIGTNARSHAPQVTNARTPRPGIAAACSAENPCR